MLHYYVDRVLAADMARVLSLTPLVDATVRSLAAQHTAAAAAAAAAGITTTATATQPALCSFLPLFCAELCAAVRCAGLELCRRDVGVLDSLFALLKCAVDAVLTPLTSHADSLLWSAWDVCKPQLHEQVERIEQVLQQTTQQPGISVPHPQTSEQHHDM